MAKRSNSKRGNGEGSIYFREDKNLWCSSITLRFDENDKQKRRVVYGKTREEVIAKKRELETAVNSGNYVEPTKMTVGEFLAQWMEVYKNFTPSINILQK